jgi:FMN-dependent NADH-azoreductase
MKEILFVTSSALGEHSGSRRIGLALVEAAQKANDGLRLHTRDVTGIPHVSLDGLSALRTDPKNHTPAQAAAVAFADGVIEEVERASLIVIAAPMYTFTIPSTLKAWIEHLNRPGRAFRQTEHGAEGLLTGKKVVVVATRGSVFAKDDPMNFQENYLAAVLGFFGMKDIDLIVAEGTAHEGGKDALRAAEERATRIGAKLALELE